MKFSTVLANVALIASSVVYAELDPIVIKGSKFFYKSNGTEFFIRGIAYQQEISSNGTSDGTTKYTDPLANPSACKRDIPLMRQLLTNTIRVYAIDPDKDHKECMQMLQDAGIYVIADLSEPATSIDRSDPKWNSILYKRYTRVVDVLAPYSNVLGFFAGNEVSNNDTNTNASAFVKAAVRDMKSYIKQKNYRTIGVGYATNDDAAIRRDMSDYFNCGKRDDSIDFWGYNIYSWCGDSSFKESGYDKVVEEFSAYSVPIFFAEYGCNLVQPRKFTEVAALFGPQMTPVVSGGIVYMYFQETNDYGLVEVNGDSASKLPDFAYLSSQMAKATPKGVDIGAYNPTNTAPQPCPTNTDNWKASETLPPTPNKDLCECMTKSLKCVAKPSISDEDMGTLFGTVCGLGTNICGGISADATKGIYGAYSMCSPLEQLSFAFNAYFQQQAAKGGGQGACDFNGAATTQTPDKTSGACAPLISEAGTDGLRTVTSAPTSTSSGSPKKSGAAPPLAAPAFNFGMIQLGAYVVCAVLAGSAMIFL